MSADAQSCCSAHGQRVCLSAERRVLVAVDETRREDLAALHGPSDRVALLPAEYLHAAVLLPLSPLLRRGRQV